MVHWLTFPMKIVKEGFLVYIISSFCPQRRRGQHRQDVDTSTLNRYFSDLWLLSLLTWPGRSWRGFRPPKGPWSSCRVIRGPGTDLSIELVSKIFRDHPVGGDKDEFNKERFYWSNCTAFVCINFIPSLDTYFSPGRMFPVTVQCSWWNAFVSSMALAGWKQAFKWETPVVFKNLAQVRKNPEVGVNS